MVHDILLIFLLVIAHYLRVLIDERLVAENHGWCELDVGTPCQDVVVIEDMSVTSNVELETDPKMIVSKPITVLIFEDIDGGVFIRES